MPRFYRTDEEGIAVQNDHGDVVLVISGGTPEAIATSLKALGCEVTEDDSQEMVTARRVTVSIRITKTDLARGGESGYKCPLSRAMCRALGAKEAFVGSSGYAWAVGVNGERTHYNLQPDARAFVDNWDCDLPVHATTVTLISRR